MKFEYDKDVDAAYVYLEHLLKDGEVVENPTRRFLSGVASRVRGLLPGYRK